MTTPAGVELFSMNLISCLHNHATCKRNPYYRRPVLSLLGLCVGFPVVCQVHALGLILLVPELHVYKITSYVASQVSSVINSRKSSDRRHSVHVLLLHTPRVDGITISFVGVVVIVLVVI